MKLLSIRQLKEVKGIPYSRPHIYRLVRSEEFPGPIHLSKNRIGFIEEEIDHWIQCRIEDRDRRGGGRGADAPDDQIPSLDS
jgi:prophage regulatory protein